MLSRIQLFTFTEFTKATQEAKQEHELAFLRTETPLQKSTVTETDMTVGAADGPGATQRCLSPLVKIRS